MAHYPKGRWTLSHQLSTRVESVCVILPSVIITIAGSIAYSESLELGLYDLFLKEVTMIVS